MQKLYFTRFFKQNIKIHKKFVERNEKISLNNSTNTISIVIMNSVTITNRSEMADAFKNYFPKVARDIQFSIGSAKKM